MMLTETAAPVDAIYDGSVVHVRNTFIEVLKEKSVRSIRRLKTDSPESMEARLMKAELGRELLKFSYLDDEVEMSPSMELCQVKEEREHVATEEQSSIDVVSTPDSPCEQAELLAALDGAMFGLPSLTDRNQTNQKPVAMTEQHSLPVAWVGCLNAQPQAMFCTPVLVPIVGPVYASESAVTSSNQGQSTAATVEKMNCMQEAAMVESASEKPNARARLLGQVMRTHQSNGCHLFVWCVDARKLRGNSKQVVSPAFEVCTDSDGQCAPFRLTLYPKRFGSRRSGVTFESCRGHGSVQLKCEGELSSEMRFRLSIGSESRKKVTQSPVLHDFSQSAVAVPPKGQDEWNFFGAVDSKSETFMVTLEIIPDGAAGNTIGPVFGGA